MSIPKGSISGISFFNGVRLQSNESNPRHLDPSRRKKHLLWAVVSTYQWLSHKKPCPDDSHREQKTIKKKTSWFTSRKLMTFFSFDDSHSRPSVLWSRLATAGAYWNTTRARQRWKPVKSGLKPVSRAVMSAATLLPRRPDKGQFNVSTLCDRTFQETLQSDEGRQVVHGKVMYGL